MRLLRNIVGTASLMLAATASHATLYNGSYTVTANGDSGAGLAVATLNDFGSVVDASTNSFTGLNVPLGGTHFTDLFELFALDSPPYSGSDLAPLPISVSFSFTSPAAMTRIITGTTVGLLSDEGLLHWSGPVTLIFPERNVLRITLSDASFGDSFNGIVTAQFDQFIPEPGTMALVAIALVGGLARRQRNAA